MSARAEVKRARRLGRLPSLSPQMRAALAALRWTTWTRPSGVRLTTLQALHRAGLVSRQTYRNPDPKAWRWRKSPRALGAIL